MHCVWWSLYMTKGFNNNHQVPNCPHSIRGHRLGPCHSIRGHRLGLRDISDPQVPDTMALEHRVSLETINLFMCNLFVFCQYVVHVQMYFIVYVEDVDGGGVSYSRRLPALVWISSLWHSGHWAEITLRQHRLRPSQCFVLIKQSDSPCPLQFWVGCSLHRESARTRSSSFDRSRA